MKTVSDLLKAKPQRLISVRPEQSVLEAIKVLAAEDIGAAIVMSGDSIAGIFSERDYTRKVILMDRSSKHTKVHEIMTKGVTTITSDATVEEAMRVMTKHRVRHLPVVDRDGHVTGLVSIGDLVERTIATQRLVLEQLEGYIVGRYPG